MVEGSLAKFRKENALLSQLFVMDNKTPVRTSSPRLQGSWHRHRADVFVRFQLGEGIEKKQDDFAAEVAAAAGTNKAEPVA
jgi:elongation factor Ts